jgi:hypothetical protein
MGRRFALLRFAAVALGVFALGACQSPPPRPTFPELTWTHLAPFRLDVAEIEIVSEYEPTFRPPNVEHLTPALPEGAARRWAEDRIEAAGREGRAKVIIREASIVEVPLALEEGVRGYVTTEQAERYDAVVEVEIEIRGPRGYRDGFAKARAERTRTVPEDITLNERERVWFELTDGLMKDFDAEMSKNIRQHLARFLL